MRRRWVLLSLGIAAVAGVVLAVLPLIVQRVAVSQIKAATGRDAAIGDVDLNLFTGRIAVKGFTLAGKGQTEPFVQFERLEGRVRLLPLLAGHLRLADGSLSNPTVRLVRTGPREFNFSDLLRTKPEAKPRALDVTVERFALSGGSVVLQDLAVPSHPTWRADNLAVTARALSTRPAGEGGSATISFALGQTPVSLN